FLRQCFISVDVDEDIVADVIRRIGDDNIVISTDYPHADSHWPHAVDSFMAIGDLSAESRKKILCDNCARVYGISGGRGDGWKFARVECEGKSGIMEYWNIS